jgi:hypothetical protein
MARHKREWVSKRSLRWLGGRDRVRGEAITPRAVIGPSLGRHCDRRARAGARTKAIAASRGRARSVLGDSTSAAAPPSVVPGVASGRRDGGASGCGSRRPGSGPNALIAECRARTEACNNARLPMQTRFGRSGIAAPPAEPTAWSPTIRMSPLQSPGPVPPENKAVVLIPAGTLSRLGESSSEANLLLPRRWSKQRHPAECADALLRVGQTSGLRCCRFASRSDRLRPRNSGAAGCRPSELCGPHIAGLCEVDVVRAPGLLGLTWWTCNRRGGWDARSSDTRW